MKNKSKIIVTLFFLFTLSSYAQEVAKKGVIKVK